MNMASQFRKDETFVIGIDIGTYGFGYSIAQSTRGSKLCDCVITRRYHMPLTFNDKDQLINIGKTPTCFPKSYYVIPSVLPQLLTSIKTENIQMLQLKDEKGENRNAVEVVSSVFRFFKEEAMQCLSCSLRSDSDIVWTITFDDYIIKSVLVEASIRVGLPPDKTHFVKVACALSVFCDSLIQRSQGKGNSCLIVNMGAGEVKEYIPRGIDVQKSYKTKKEGCRPPYGEFVKTLLIERNKQISQIIQEAEAYECLSKSIFKLFDQLENIIKTVPELRNVERVDTVGQIWSKIKSKFEETIQTLKDGQMRTEESAEPLLNAYDNNFDKEAKDNSQEFVKKEYFSYERLLVRIKTVLNICIGSVWSENIILKENYASTTNITFQIENPNQRRIVEDSTNKHFNSLSTKAQLSMTTNSPMPDTSKDTGHLDENETKTDSDRSATNELSDKNMANERLSATLHIGQSETTISHEVRHFQPGANKIPSDITKTYKHPDGTLRNKILGRGLINKTFSVFSKTKQSSDFSTNMPDGTQRRKIPGKYEPPYNNDEYNVWLCQTNEVIRKMKVHINSIVATSQDNDDLCRDICSPDIRNTLDKFRQNFEDAYSVLKQKTNKMYFNHTENLVIDSEELLEDHKTMLKKIHTQLIMGIVKIFTDLKQCKEETDSSLKDTTTDIRFSDIIVSDAGRQVTQNFESFIEELVGHVTWTEFKSNHSLDYLEMIDMFEKEKAVFEDSESINIYLPPVLSAIEVGLEEKIQSRVSKSDRSDFYEENERKLLLSSKTVHDFFKPVVDGLLDKLTHTLHHYMGCSKITALVLVGGFAQSAYLRKRVQSELRQRVVGTEESMDLIQSNINENFEIIIPLNAAEATQVGASLRSDYHEDHWFCQN